MRTAFFQRLENFLRRATRRCALARRCCCFANRRGFSISVPSLNTANDDSPTSMPTALSFGGSGCGCTTTLKQAYQCPFSRLMVKVLITPLIGRCNLILTSPIFDNDRRPFSRYPDCG